jgi:serine/threonine protein kinase
MNVVETVDLVQDEAAHWCEVMEYCPGGDLYAAIKKGGMSSSEVECCFKQMLKGVGYLHSQGVAHRDIKPENLFFDTKGHLKVSLQFVPTLLSVRARGNGLDLFALLPPLVSSSHSRKRRFAYILLPSLRFRPLFFTSYCVWTINQILMRFLVS